MLLGSVQAVQKAARFAGGAIENNQFSPVLDGWHARCTTKRK
jgi:hypothetical protein